jgi:hypothetical protein
MTSVSGDHLSQAPAPPSRPDIERVRAAVARAGGDTDKLLGLANTSIFLANKLMDRASSGNQRPGNAQGATEYLAITCLALAEALGWPELSRACAARKS